jgi:hypothetical protein
LRFNSRSKNSTFRKKTQTSALLTDERISAATVVSLRTRRSISICSGRPKTKPSSSLAQNRSTRKP